MPFRPLLVTRTRFALNTQTATKLLIDIVAINKPESDDVIGVSMINVVRSLISLNSNSEAHVLD